MSRTHRRKSGRDRNYRRNWAESRESFDEIQAEYLSLSWKTEYVSQWNGQTYTRKWYHREVSQYRDYEQYIAAIDARYHADGRHYGGGVPRAFRNTCCERPLRAAHKQELAKAKKTGDWEAVLLQPFVHDAAWLYW